MNSDDEARLRHGVYISEPSSDSSDSERDYDDVYDKNKPDPEFVETESVVVCEPFQRVRRRRKPNAFKCPTLVISSAPKTARKKYIKRSKNAKVRVKSAVPETRRAATKGRVCSNLPECTNVTNPTKISFENSNAPSFVNKINESFLPNNINQPLSVMHKGFHTGHSGGANGILNIYYVPQDQTGVGRSLSSAQSKQHVAKPPRRRRRATKKSENNAQSSTKAVQNSTNSQRNGTNQTKLAVIYNSYLEAASSNLKSNKETAKNCISPAYIEPAIKSAKNVQPKTFKESKNVRNGKDNQNAEKTKRISSTNRVENNMWSQKENCLSVPNQQDVIVNRESFQNEKLLLRRSRLPPRLQKSCILKQDNNCKEVDSSCSFMKQQLPQSNFTTFMKQSITTFHKHSTTNGICVQSPLEALPKKKEKCEKSDKDIDPAVKLMNGLHVSNTHDSASSTYSNEHKIPSLLDIDPFSENNLLKNKKERKRFSIAIQTGCSYKQLRSVQTQTDNLETM